MRELRDEQFGRHSHEAVAYHQTRKDHVCGNAYCSAEPFCGEEVANHHHRQLECGGGTRKGERAYSSTVDGALEPFIGLEGRKELTKWKHNCTS
jgi:hypothetical protein